MANISQQEARRLKRRVKELENVLYRQRLTYAAEYPNGINIATITYANEQDFLPAVIHTSRRLGHGVVAVADGRVIRFYALPHPDTKP